MERTIDICVTCDEKEFRRAISFYILRICDIRNYAVTIFVTMLIVTIWSLWVSDYGLLLAGACLACGYAAFYFYYKRPMEGYLRYYKKRGTLTYRFCDDKISIATEDVQSECLWTVFQKAYEIPSAFLLADANKFLYIVPKSAFADICAVERLRNLMRTKFRKFKIYE